MRWVSPFGYLRIFAHLQLPEAFRSLSRPSSAPDAKAFPLRSSSLDYRRSLDSSTLIDRPSWFSIFGELCRLFLGSYFAKIVSYPNFTLIIFLTVAFSYFIIISQCSVFKVQSNLPIPQRDSMKSPVSRELQSISSFRLVEISGIAFLRKSHGGCNMPPACCQCRLSIPLLRNLLAGGD